MGQATADLPDPLATSPAGPASTDDLLAQLAGEEIERLLAETDTVVPPQPPEGAASKDVPRAQVTSTPQVAETAPTAPVPATPAAPREDELEALFTQLDGNAAAPAPEAKATVELPKSESHAEEPSVADALAAEMEEDAAQHAAPLATVAAMASGASETAAQEAEASKESDNPSILVRILAAFSSPLDSCPDHVRDLIGKIAILTMLNALCVLAYVIFFRR